MFLLKVYIKIHKFGFICILETYVDSASTSTSNLKIAEYNLVSSDYLLNLKRGEGSLYILQAFFAFKNSRYLISTRNY